MSGLPACQVCGCTSYTKVSGYFVCSNCDTQSQEIEEQLFEYSEAQGRVDDEEREEIITKSVVTNRELTSWESCNFILKGFVQEFIELGASPQLRVIAFQLWASYLQKANVAFFSKQTDKLPFLPLGFKSSDAKILYGVPNLRKTLFKDLMFKRKSKMTANFGNTEEVPDMEDSSSSASSGNRSILSLRSLRHKQRKLALTELSESSPNESFSQNESLLTLGSDKKSKSRKRMKVSFKSATQQALKSLLQTVKFASKLSDREKMLRVRNLVVRRMHDCKRNTIVEGNMVATKATLISVIRIALLLIGDDILLGDILRWISEGRVSMNQPEKFIPRAKKTREGRAEIFQCNRNGYEIDIKNFTRLLNIHTVPAPNLYKLVERYCEDLCLPNEFTTYVQGIMNVFQPKMNYKDYDFRVFPNFECRVLAYILFSFKLLFSLDGLTERKQSAFADHINNLRNQSVNAEVPLLFSWNSWVHYMECRKAILSKYDPVVNMHAYKGRIDNSEVFEKHWDRVKPIYAVNSDAIDPIFISTTQQNLKKIIGDDEQSSIDFPPSLTPHISNLNHLLFNHPQVIPDSARSILEDNFKHYSILFLIRQEMCRQIASSCNVQVEFVDGVAEVDMEEFEPAKSALPVVSKTTVIPAYVATPVDVIDDPPRTTKGKTKYDRCKKFRFDCQSFDTPERSSVREIFKIYNPSKEYWFFHEFHRGISNEHFNELAETNFSDSFFWLLKELAYMVKSDLKDLYLELMVIESVLYSLLVESEYSSRCSVNLYANEW